MAEPEVGVENLVNEAVEEVRARLKEGVAQGTGWASMDHPRVKDYLLGARAGAYATIACVLRDEEETT